MIRTAKKTDAEEIARLSAQLGYSTAMEQIKSHIDRFIGDKNAAIFVYEIPDNHLAGWVHVFGKHLIHTKYAEIGGLVVDKTFRRQGIGLQLMKKSEEWARENNYEERGSREPHRLIPAFQVARGHAPTEPILVCLLGGEGRWEGVCLRESLDVQ